MFRQRQPLAWLFHRNTSRSTHNMVSTVEPMSPTGPKEYPNAPVIPLGTPRLPETTLAHALDSRLSCRRFTGAPLSLEALGTLLYAGYGVRGTTHMNDLALFERTVPSGGGLYPLELYVLAHAVEQVPSGIHHYSPVSHALEQVREGGLPPGLCTRLFMQQPYLEKASAVLVVTLMPERSLWKYSDRGYRYLLLESGHVAQNINLTATALGVGSFNLGGFFDLELAELLSLDAEREFPVYGIALGMPEPLSRAALRTPTDL
ncbi:SagB/ThcOx family dehydrogenase [Myxococcus landrumensis]|uniref:SagB/ThcOx family dehydrogenase n=1 Tax=Myxococcus landrumensis TaxID=2813577 RepID=A0ABX7N3Y1_9BACT|nr:SagB/ThcOx family dehydrogenase [Myxococcus landrumus]QSQ13422.1 SagB/ThcOx family dehydrogenase [Myxococcus landrumus]